jgi:hypothetical protein
MKMFALATVTTLAALFPGLAAEAAEPAKQERKLEGDELAKFYLQQILDQAEDEPIVIEQRDLMQELRSLVQRLDVQHRERLAKQKAEAEKQAAEKAKIQAEGNRRVASADPAEPTADTVVTLKPVLDEPTEAPLAPGALPPMRNTAPARDVVKDPAVRPAGAELPAATIDDDAGKPDDSDADSELDDNADGGLDGNAAGNADGATLRPRWEQVRGLVVALDNIIGRLQTLKVWLVGISQES